MRSLAAIAMLALASACPGQMEIRPLLGVNVQNLTKPDDGEWNGKPGYQLGVDLLMGNKFFFRTGAQFVIANTQYVYKTSDTLPSFEAEFTSTSLRVPLHIGLRLKDAGDEPALNLRVFGGGAVTFPLSTKFDEDGLAEVETTATLLGLGFGAGIDISIFYIDAGYDVGISNVFDDQEFDVNSKANMFWANIGVRLKFAE